ETLSLTGPRGEVAGPSFSLESNRIAITSLDGTIKVWDARTGQEKVTLRGHRGEITGVVFRSESNQIISSSRDNTVKVWDARTGQQTQSFKMSHRSSREPRAILSPDGNHIACTTFPNVTVSIWKLRDDE